ncbi:late competence development ComFB family protein [Piscinibacter sp. XHJ-5]|uniref:late competence development ComFB family protein n=1 Tax=Piscinibacter sp. XHJ-5 TaxID=3037797 RepID=UPI002452D7A0|nr:late competence development ComFB family protein [Piscinibacter sp. XHJ-5]
MNVDFDSIHNHHERAVIEAVRAAAKRYPHLDEELLADIACVALNRLPPRYIRHEVDFAFYLTDKERGENERAIAEAVGFAFEFVQARIAMRARA